MNRFMSLSCTNHHWVGLIALCLVTAQTWGEEPAKETTHTIFGLVVEVRSGTPDVPVCLCDGVTGLPLTKGTYKAIEWGVPSEDGHPPEIAIQLTNMKGEFRFENVPEGKYRLVAQRWMGPYKGPIEVHGTVIQLMGVANDVVVPRPTNHHQALVALTPPGHGIIQFEQEVDNNETFLFLSTSAPEFDPVLGMNALGASFYQHLIGFNRMPLGRTTVIGVPDAPIYAFFFAADNSPGTAAVNIPASKSGLIRVSPEPFVAGWSNARKTPPPKLQELIRFLDAHSLTSEKLLQLPPLSAATFVAHRKRMDQLVKEMSRIVELPEGKSARVADILAVDAYRELAK